VVLVLGHLFIMNLLDGGVQRINWAFVAGRWASPFWQVWDLLMLWLAMLHGANGLRTVINDYTRRDGTRLLLKVVLYTATTITIALGTLVIFTFDPTL
jgi:succinate dehydrogenase / fumarate reductase membrane anchor subunit